MATVAVAKLGSETGCGTAPNHMSNSMKRGPGVSHSGKNLINVDTISRILDVFNICKIRQK